MYLNFRLFTEFFIAGCELSFLFHLLAILSMVTGTKIMNYHSLFRFLHILIIINTKLKLLLIHRIMLIVYLFYYSVPNLQCRPFYGYFCREILHDFSGASNDQFTWMSK